MKEQVFVCERKAESIGVPLWQRVSALKTLYLDRKKHKSFFFYKSNMVIVRFKVTTNGVVTLPSENKSDNILCDTKALSNHDIETKPS